MVMRIVGVSGNFTRPSKTRTLVEGVLSEVVRAGLGTTECFDIQDAGPTLGTTMVRAGAAANLDRIWSAIEGCDALVVGTPIYKGSYAGLFKHLFDVIDKDALVGCPVVLCATSRIAEHALVIEHQLRPLFGFFRCVTIPLGLHATHQDFGAGNALVPSIQARITRQVNYLAALLSVNPGRAGVF